MVAQSQPLTARIDPTRKAGGKPFHLGRKLNVREKRFCSLIVQGRTARDAYQIVSGASAKGTLDVQSWRWKARPAIQAEIAKMRSQLTEEGALSRAEKRHHLANITRADETETREKLTAIAIDNRMTGDDDPFRKAAGDDLRVNFFVIRVEEDEPREVQNVTPSAAAPSLTAGEPIQLPPP